MKLLDRITGKQERNMLRKEVNELRQMKEAYHSNDVRKLVEIGKNVQRAYPN